jgi:hypothetical protein
MTQHLQLVSVTSGMRIRHRLKEYPPLTGMVCPVIQLDAPEARNRTRLAASSGSPKRLMARARIELVTLEPDRFLYRVYDGTWGYDEFNPGLRGDSRFAPIDDPVTAKRLPSMYLGETPTTVLLETVFHDVHEAGRIVYENTCTKSFWRTSRRRPPQRREIFAIPKWTDSASSVVRSCRAQPSTIPVHAG